MQPLSDEDIYRIAYKVSCKAVKDVEIAHDAAAETVLKKPKYIVAFARQTARWMKKAQYQKKQPKPLETDVVAPVREAGIGDALVQVLDRLCPRQRDLLVSSANGSLWAGPKLSNKDKQSLLRARTNAKKLLERYDEYDAERAKTAKRKWIHE